MITIEGSRIVDVPSFYAELNRAFMTGEDWELGETLDGLNDIMYGGYGALAGDGPRIVMWRDMDASREALGPEATRQFLIERSASRHMFNGATIADQLAALAEGHGKTYFDIVMDVFADHPDITLISG